MWFWIGFTLGGAVGTFLGMLVLALCVAAGRENTEDWVDHLDDRGEAWMRGER